MVVEPTKLRVCAFAQLPIILNSHKNSKLFRVNAYQVKLLYIYRAKVLHSVSGFCIITYVEIKISGTGILIRR